MGNEINLYTNIIKQVPISVIMAGTAVHSVFLKLCRKACIEN